MLSAVGSVSCPFSCSSVEFSPFEDRRFAVATAQYFGVVGNGRQHVFEMDPGGSGAVLEIGSFDSPSGLTDCAWSECNQFQVASACTDGSVLLWDLGARDGFPVERWQEHTGDASSVDWNVVTKDTVLSSSVDGTVKLWQPGLGGRSVATYYGNGGTVYNAIWCPHSPSAFVTCSSDGHLRTWDTQTPEATLVIPAHEDEVLAVDWDKYSEWTIVSGSVDRSLRVWDIRYTQRPTNMLMGHGFAIKRLKCHPFVPGYVGSVSLDMSACLWNAEGPRAGLLARSHYHTEFSLGIDFSLFTPSRFITCSWDQRVSIWDFLDDKTSPPLGAPVGGVV